MSEIISLLIGVLIGYFFKEEIKNMIKKAKK